MKIQLDDGTLLEQRSVMTAVTNGRCVGGGFWLTPDARADDGRFDVMIAQGLNRAEILAFVPRVTNGTHVNHPVVRMTHAARVVIDSPDPVVVEADGEIPFLRAHHLEVELLAQRLCIMV